ncbi:hypothetical protein K7H91_20750 [Martelella mediterranea]|uniref:hypothetical protein n=1 Tax=Martelella mediterranea TaxID=293089 RepID=UPI001E59C87C|nr:hypothetical protein [Martelella mediterranea]MCD1636193.1 hypothetical protein [Martelella mediterranea]
MSEQATGNASTSKPDAPAITTYRTSVIGGTEATPGTVVVVHNVTQGRDVNPGGASVFFGSWQIQPTGADTPKDGDEITAVAWMVENGNLTVSSDPSQPKTVSAFVPPSPEIMTSYPDDVEGTEFILQPSLQAMTTVYIAPQLDISRTPVGNSGHLTGQSWAITPSPSRSPGETMVAWAQTDAGAKSAERPFTIVEPDEPIAPKSEATE